jgi:monoamine oxidase
VLTDYTGGALGAGLLPANVQRDTLRFLRDLDRVFPGSFAYAMRDRQGRFRVHLENWSLNPLALGAYTCPQPGYFTSIAGNEAKPVGNLFFAGEHTDSFYAAQGFLEGAANSGLRAATEVAALR